MRGVDPRTLQILGNWRSLAMVERYAHLAPDHLRAAVERLVSPGVTVAAAPAPPPADGVAGAVQLARDFTVRQDEGSCVA